MAITPSNMLPLGTKAPEFCLFEPRTGKELSLDELKSEIATVIMFICNHCPFVVHIKDEMAEVARHYQKKGISFIAISSNDIETRPEDGPEDMKKEAEMYHYSFPYLYDDTQEIAKAYQAACTPDIYVFDKNLACVYRGRFDGSSPGNDQPVDGKDLKDALDAILDGKPVNADQKPSYGCNIKWRK